jgi:hypothetical protein
MKGTRRNLNLHPHAIDASGEAGDGREQVRNAIEYLLLRDGLGDGGVPDSFPPPFARDRRAAAATADGIMANIRVQPDAARFRSDRRVFRIASMAAAAVLIAAFSSILTVNLMRSDATVDVRFVLVAPEASSVHLAADFNQWSPDGYDMVMKPDGSWEITVPLRKGRAYAYNFIIDGERWIADPAGTMLLEDGFGGSSSSISL